MDNFYEFTKKSDLIINEKKSEVMVFNFSKSYAFPPNLTIGKSDIIREVTVTKLLGVKIQSDLRWQENTNYICKRATGKLWVLRRLKILHVETEHLIDVYKKRSEISPRTYCASLAQWSNTKAEPHHRTGTKNGHFKHLWGSEVKL